MQNQKSGILAQLNSYRLAKPGPFWGTLAVAGLSMFGMMAAFGTSPGTLEQQIVQQTVVEQLAKPPLLALEEDIKPFVREERILRGDSVASLLTRLGADDAAAHTFLLTNRDAQAVARQLSPGKSVSAQVGAKGELLSLVFPLNGGKDQALFIQRSGDSFSATTQALPLETQVLIKSAEIRSSLFGATDAADIPDSVATQLADIFGGDIDFHRDLRKGDHFTVVFESITHLGKEIRTGRILAAEFVNDGKPFTAFWYGNASGEGGYYNAEGKNIRKAFLRSPLEFSRITSGFSNARFHPVLQTMRAHKGVDYGAPSGTKIRSTADGIVEFAGRKGGYGNVLILRHANSTTTLYGHLSGFAAGVRTGKRVGQGETIGYVGATGLATGPHLHYEFRINDVHRNPLTVAMPSAPPLSAAQLPDFKNKIQSYLSQIEMTRGGNLALLN